IARTDSRWSATPFWPRRWKIATGPRGRATGRGAPDRAGGRLPTAGVAAAGPPGAGGGRPGDRGGARTPAARGRGAPGPGGHVLVAAGPRGRQHRPAWPDPRLGRPRLTTYLQAWSAPRRAHLGDRADSPDIDPETGRRIPYSRLLGQAFCALLEHYPADRLPQHGGTATTINLTVELDDLLRPTGCATTTDNPGEDISIDQLLRLACTADLMPSVFDSEGQPLWLGRTTRLFKPHQRPGDGAA
ncbi:MAG TPA: DUF222 domain-containing protein, partial [Nocardioides sp.]|nr:DUF222 domain-containing protein [Nocardioides sp.]